MSDKRKLEMAIFAALLNLLINSVRYYNKYIK